MVKYKDGEKGGWRRRLGEEEKNRIKEGKKIFLCEKKNGTKEKLEVKRIQYQFPCQRHALPVRDGNKPTVCLFCLSVLLPVGLSVFSVFLFVNINFPVKGTPYQ